jgi:threonine-phosphate decarboxylase
VAARAAYKDSAYLRTSRRFILSEKKMIIKMLHEIKWIRLYDTDTNMLLMKIDKNSDEVAGQLRRAGLDIRNCTDIIGLNSSFFRISVMKHENNLQLISALRKL